VPRSRDGRAVKALDFEAVRQIAISLPEVKESITNWGWAFKVRGKLLACQAVHRSAERDSLVVKIGFDDRAQLLSAEPDKFYVTPHYAPYPSVLVRVSKMSPAGMRSVLQMAWSYATRDPASASRAPGTRKARK
jgi:hypothetical protein